MNLFDYAPGTPESPSIGGVPWDGSIYLRTPFDAVKQPVETLKWRLQYDALWVCENLVTILDKKSNRPTKFVFNRTQRWAYWNILDQLSRGEPVMIWGLKGRQFGWSTLAIVLLYLRTIFLGQNSLSLVNLETTGKSIFRKAELAHKAMPTLEFDLTDAQGVVTGKQVVTLVDDPSTTSGASLMAWVSKEFSALMRRESAENIDAGVGETWQNVHLSEVPLFRDAEHTLGVLDPAMSHEFGSMEIGEFTGRNEGDLAHLRWEGSVAGDTGYRAVFGGWYWHETYRAKRKDTDVEFSPEELKYRDMVALCGHEYPLTDDGRLIPRLREIHDRGDRIEMHHIATGFELSDEQLWFRRGVLGRSNRNYARWRSEYPATPEEAFAQAKRKLIDPDAMDIMAAKARDPLPGQPGRGEYKAHQSARGKGRARWMPNTTGRVWRWELPRAGATYMIDCDPSSGVGVDPCGINVLRVEYGKLTCVATFEGFERPPETARLLARIGRHYRDGALVDPVSKRIAAKTGMPCEIAVERNNFGDAVITELRRLNYRRIWRYTSKKRDDYKKGHEYGFPTYKDTKMPMLNDLAGFCSDGVLTVYCRRTLDSLRNLQYLDDEDKTAGAPRGKHDDLAMAIGIGCHAAAQTSAFRFKPVDEKPEWLRDPDFLLTG